MPKRQETREGGVEVKFLGRFKVSLLGHSRRELIWKRKLRIKSEFRFIGEETFKRCKRFACRSSSVP